jgi:hypothetical protein
MYKHESTVCYQQGILHGMQVEFSSADENENELSAANGGRRNKFQVDHLLTLRKFLVWKDDC